MLIFDFRDHIHKKTEAKPFKGNKNKVTSFSLVDFRRLYVEQLKQELNVHKTQIQILTLN